MRNLSIKQAKDARSRTNNSQAYPMDPIFPTAMNGGLNVSEGQPALCHQRRGFKGGMSIASLNVNGIHSHLDEIQLLMNTLEAHIMALNETKIDPGYPAELTAIRGYPEERLERSARGGGVSTYIRDSICNVFSICVWEGSDTMTYYMLV